MDRITIGEYKYSVAELQLLQGACVEEGSVPDEYILLMARVMEEPMSLPRLLKDICSLGSSLDEYMKQELRLALLRIQIESELRMHEDILRYQQRRYVAQVIEILIFKDLLLAPREVLEEED